jgi:predicted esterase
LRQEAVSHAASHIVATLTKIVFLHGTGVDQWNLSSLNPNRAKWLAQIGWKSTNQSVQRMVPERRYPILVVLSQFLFEAF